MADANHGEATATLHHYGCIVASDPTGKYVEEPARADIKAIKEGRAVCVEVKDGKDENGHSYFDLNEWRPNQREWSEKYCETPPFSTPYWVWLRIGLRRNSSTEPYKTWLVPRNIFLAMDAQVQQYQSRLVYRVRAGLRREIQDLQIDAITLLSGWELTWNSGGALRRPDWILERFPDRGEYYEKGIYTIPEDHPFYYRFIQPRNPFVTQRMRNDESIPIPVSRRDCQRAEQGNPG